MVGLVNPRFFTTVSCLLLSAPGFAKEIMEPVPTRLEEFASRPDAEVVLEHEIAHFSHEGGHAWIYAIVMEAAEPEHEIAQGLLVELQSDRGEDFAYLNSEDTLRVISDIKKLYGAEQKMLSDPEEPQAKRQIGGTGSPWCFRRRPMVHMLCPEVFRTSETSWILLRIMTVEPYYVGPTFPDMRLAELEAALIRGWIFLFNRH